MHSFDSLRAQYPVFRYRGFSVTPEREAVRVQYDFAVDGLTEFAPTWVLPCRDPAAFPGEDPAVRALLFSIGMTEAVSYWKAACPPRMLVSAGPLDAAQIAWWKKLYFHGLGEFFYKNGIRTSEADFLTIECDAPPAPLPRPLTPPQAGCLIPVGGGKDSVVTMELLRAFPQEKTAYLIGAGKAGVATARIAGFDAAGTVSFARTLDPRLLALNAEGFLNGHTPFSALVAFSAVLAAYLGGRRYVVLSNEGSANESTVAGSDVNHQYSKSLEFEADFRAYLAAHLPCGVEYFSLLRPFHEIQIARCFTRYPQYFGAFLSCNVGSKTGRWCAKCAKCLFICLMLAPFLPPETLRGIFGRDLLDDPAMREDFRKLLGLAPEKPFECVGSRAEVSLACALAAEAYDARGEALPLLLREYRALALPAPDRGMLRAKSEAHFVPDAFLPYLTPLYT